MTDLAAAYELAAQWHDKHSRGAREIADDIRVGADIQAKALVASKHHAASAAGSSARFERFTCSGLTPSGKYQTGGRQ